MTPLTLSDIAARCESTYGSLSPLVRALTEAGFIRVQAGPGEGRSGPASYRYELTDMGFDMAVKQVEEGREKYGGLTLLQLRREGLQERLGQIVRDQAALEAERQKHAAELASLSETVSS